MRAYGGCTTRAVRQTPALALALALALTLSNPCLTLSNPNSLTVILP